MTHITTPRILPPPPPLPPEADGQLTETYSDMRREFWMKVYLEAMQTGIGASSWKSIADDALRDLDSLDERVPRGNQ